MLTIPSDIHKQLQDSGQEHVLACWDRLDDGQRRQLLEQLRGIDLEQLRQLYGQRDKVFSAALARPHRPVPVSAVGQPGARTARAREARRLGEEALRRGEVAALVVAGGQGSRLGFEHPKGMFPSAPSPTRACSRSTPRRCWPWRRRYGKPLPFLVMTSPATTPRRRRSSQQHQLLRPAARRGVLLRQGTMPALDLATGKLLLESPGRLFTSPNGHGGTLTALADTGLLDRLRQRGIRHLFYFQVDNPLVKVADPVFLGHHLAARAEVRQDRGQEQARRTSSATSCWSTAAAP